MRMLTPNLSINVAAKVESMIYWKINDKAKEPYRATPMSAGVDVYALNPDLIVPNTIKVVPTGIGCQMPSNHYGQLSTRSSLAQRGVIVVGGVIDPDYHGEIKVILMNVGLNPFVVSQGDRIAQLLIIPIHIEPIREGEAPSELTVRGDKGFGSSDTVNVGAKIWIQKPHGPPEAAVVIAVGKDRVLLIMKPGQEKWEYVPQGKCYLRD